MEFNTSVESAEFRLPENRLHWVSEGGSCAIKIEHGGGVHVDVPDVSVSMNQHRSFLLYVDEGMECFMLHMLFDRLSDVKDTEEAAAFAMDDCMVAFDCDRQNGPNMKAGRIAREDMRRYMEAHAV